MLIPNKTKYKKAFKGRIRGNASNGFIICNGDYALKSVESFRINSRQIKAARSVVVKSLNKNGKVWVKVFPNIPVSKKPIDVRMGKGKGSVEEWVFKVKPGKIIFEVGGNITMDRAYNALLKASAKLPMKCCVIKNDNN